MNVSLIKADLNDCETVHKMQVSAFADLFEKYKDYDTSPATESVEKIKLKMSQSDYYFIIANCVKVGVIRIITVADDTRRISPVFILPEYQSRGYCQATFKAAEKLFPNTRQWLLDTIKQEEKLCRIYEKLGYEPTGEQEDIKDGMTIVFYRKLINL